MTMNVKEHKWLVWLMVVSLMLGMWNGSVVKGEENAGTEETTRQVKEITRVDIRMDDPVKGENLPSQVAVEAVLVESPVIETISTESVTVELSWSSRQSVSAEFKEISNWKKHQAENDTEYKVEITLNTTECVFKKGVEIYIGKNQGKDEVSEEVENNSTVKVSWTFTFGTLDTQTPSPTTSATSSPTQTPAETESPQTETITIESVHIDGVSPPVGGKEFPKEELTIAESAAIETFSIEWRDSSGAEVKEKRAEYEKEYQLWIGLEAKNGYEFAEKEDLKVSVNSVGEGFEVEREKDGKKVTIKCEFKTGKGPTQSASPLPTQSALPTTEPSPESPSIETPLPVVSPLPTPPTTYTITLVPNGGTVSQKSISFTAEEVSKVKLPNPTREKYVFIGWYEGKKRVEKIMEPRNMTLKAQWVTASIEMGYLSTLKWAKFKLSSDVKLTEVSIEKKYKKFVKINKKKKTLKGKKYFKKAKLTLKIDGENVTGVVLTMKIPEAKIIVKKAGGRKRYVIGVYRTYQLAYAHKPGATKAVAEYSYKKKGKYKKCVKALNRLKGGSVSVKKGRTVYMRVTIYYGKNAYSKSKPKPLKG